jgi:hypothetical protein
MMCEDGIIMTNPAANPNNGDKSNGEIVRTLSSSYFFDERQKMETDQNLQQQQQHQLLLQKQQPKAPTKTTMRLLIYMPQNVSIP